jgi:hypothetical protein
MISLFRRRGLHNQRRLLEIGLVKKATGRRPMMILRGSGWLRRHNHKLLCRVSECVTNSEHIRYRRQSLLLRGARIVRLESKFVSVLSYFNTTSWRRMGEWKYRPTYSWPSWSRVASFTPRPLYNEGTFTRYPLDRLCGSPEPVWKKSRWKLCCIYGDSNSTPRLSKSLSWLLYPDSLLQMSKLWDR